MLMEKVISIIFLSSLAFDCIFTQEVNEVTTFKAETEVTSELILQITESEILTNSTIETITLIDKKQESFIKKKRMNSNERWEAREIQAEICAVLIRTIFLRYDYLYMYSITEEDNFWIELLMKVIEKDEHFSFKYSTIKRTEIHQQTIKPKPKEKRLARKKADVILLYIENILEGESILKMWTKQFGTHDGEAFILIITKESSKSYSDMFLRRMWKNFHMFNIFILDINEFITGNISSRTQFYLYNPYKNSGENFIEYEFDENDIDKKSMEIYLDIFNRIMDLNKFPLKIKIKNNTGFTTPVLNKNGTIIRYKGRVGAIVNEYARIMNFTPVYSNQKNVQVIGDLNNPSTYQAIPTSDFDNETDLFGNYRLVQYDIDSNIRFLKTLQQVRLVIVTPSAIPECKKIGTTFHALDDWAKVATGIFLFLVVLLWTVIKVKNSSQYCTVWNKLVLVLMDCTRVTHFSAIKVPNSRWEKMLFLTLTIWIFFIGNSFTGTIITGLSVKKSQEIDTLNDLVETDLMIANMNNTENVLIRGISNMAPSEAEVRQKLYDRQFIISDPSVMWEASAHTRAFAILCPDYIAAQVIGKYYDPTDGRDLLHEMKATVMMMYSAQVIPKTSPLGEAFEYIQDTMFEAGILKQWQKMENFEVTLKKMHGVRESMSKSNNKLKLINLSTTFEVWAMMLALATIVFLIELLVSEVSDYQKFK